MLALIAIIAGLVSVFSLPFSNKHSIQQRHDSVTAPSLRGWLSRLKVLPSSLKVGLFLVYFKLSLNLAFPRFGYTIECQGVKNVRLHVSQCESMRLASLETYF